MITAAVYIYKLHEAKDSYMTLGVRYRDLQARIFKQETRNLTLQEAQSSAQC